MNNSAHNEALKALRKAETALHNANHDLAGGFFLATANRAYYTCYYSMIAMLYTQEVFAKTHQGIRTKFLELFIKTEILSVDASAIVALLFDYRQEADYDLDADISEEEAGKLIEKASQFLQMIKTYFEQLDIEK